MRPCCRIWLCSYTSHALDPCPLPPCPPLVVGSQQVWHMNPLGPALPLLLQAGMAGHVHRTCAVARGTVVASPIASRHGMAWCRG